MTASTETGNPRPKPIGSGRSGPVRAALTRSIDEARRSNRMTTEHEVTGLLAQRVAALVDIYAAQHDGDRMLKAAANLRELMDTLPIRKIHGEGGEEAPSDGDSGRGQLLRLMDGPPTVGDSAHS